MKLDSIEKRIGLVLVFAGLIVMAVLILVWVLTEPQLIGYHLPNGNVIYYKRGVMETMIANWLGVTLIGLPLCACGIGLMLGYGDKLLNWIKYGHKEGEEKEKDSNQT